MIYFLELNEYVGSVRDIANVLDILEHNFRYTSVMVEQNDFKPDVVAQIIAELEDLDYQVMVDDLGILGGQS